MTRDVRFDWDRAARTSVPEAVLCEGKSVAQLQGIAALAREQSQSVFLTRLQDPVADQLATDWDLDFDPVSKTGVLGAPQSRTLIKGQAAVVAAGTSDMPTAT